MAVANHAEAQNLLCDILCNKVRTYQLWGGILETYLPYAEDNLAFAQVIVGRVYYRGKLKERNYQKAFEWFQKAAEMVIHTDCIYWETCMKMDLM